jgi:hypothetical protein
VQKIFAITLFAVAITGCASNRTKYQPHGYEGGYSEQKVDGSVTMARFTGNAHTNANDALIFSQFRAVELCQEGGFEFPRILGVENKTAQQTVQRTSTQVTNSPTQISGTSTANARHTYSNFSGTVTGGNQSGSTASWNETLSYPIFETYFSCSSKANLVKVGLKAMSPQDLKDYVKDLMGAVQITEIPQDSPNLGILQVGDFVLKANGFRTSTFAQFVSAVDSAKNKDKIPLVVVRDGKTVAINAKAIDGTATFAAQAEKLISAACTMPEVSPRPICQKRTPASR